MANEAQKEPTMEEILASIRRIISDEDPGKTQPGAPAMRRTESNAPLSPSDILGNVREDINRPVASREIVDANADVFDVELDDDFEDFASEVDFGALDEADGPDEQAAVVEDIVAAAAPGEIDLGRAFDASVPDTDVADVLDIDILNETEAELDGIVDDFAFDGESLTSAVPLTSEARWSVEPERLAPVEVAGAAIFATGSERNLEPQLRPQAPAASEPVKAIFEADRTTKDEIMATVAKKADGGLTDDVAASAAASAMSKLMGRLDLGGEHTLEGLVREMLKPMLKEWLDQNLPRIVEAKVEEEVQRISRLAR